jgi:hypothetical protein
MHAVLLTWAIASVRTQAFLVDLGMKTLNKLKDIQVYLTGNRKLDTT